MTSEISEETGILRETIREFAEAELAPHVLEWDEAQRFPKEIVPKLAELGVMGAVLPSELGRSGLSHPECVMSERREIPFVHDLVAVENTR
jgi:alkylation response protein AidB-like acyl-CoA dehydrogenase